VFGNLQSTKKDFDGDESFLSRTMQKAWANFAKNPTAGPGFPKVGSGSKDLGMFTSIFFDANDHLVNISSSQIDQNCAIFESVYQGRA
jgi:hypothetical protein